MGCGGEVVWSAAYQTVVCCVVSVALSVILSDADCCTGSVIKYMLVCSVGDVMVFGGVDFGMTLTVWR
jgi:hypothetical protein